VTDHSLQGVMLYRASGEDEAALLTQALEANGIPCRQFGRHMGDFEEVGSDLMLVEIWCLRIGRSRPGR